MVRAPWVQTGSVRKRCLALAALALLLAACTHAPTANSGTPSPPTQSPTATVSRPAAGITQPATDWLQYHGNGARTGNVARLPAAGALSLACSARLGAAVYGQPLVIGNIVVAATESDQVYGLDRATGAVRWHVRVGTPLPLSRQPCGDLNPLGITGTPVYDPQTQLVYVVAQSGTSSHLLAAIRVPDGQIAFLRNVPAPDHQPAYDQQRGALALADGRVYVVFGGHYGDCGPYIGSVVGMPASGRGAIRSYLVPTAKQGGIWASGGPVIAPDGTIYVSAGNGAATSGSYDGSDSVTALSPQLTRTGIFAPTDWRMLSADDLDLGSMSPALLGDGRILQVGKSGVGYLLDTAHLGGVGGELASGTVCAAFGGAAVSGSIVYVPCITGLAAVNTAHDQVTVIWRGPANVWGSPVVGGGAVWVASPDSGVLYEVAPGSGKVRNQISLGRQLPHFVSPTLSGGLVLVGTLTGVTAVSGA